MRSQLFSWSRRFSEIISLPTSETARIYGGALLLLPLLVYATPFLLPELLEFLGLKIRGATLATLFFGLVSVWEISWKGLWFIPSSIAVCALLYWKPKLAVHWLWIYPVVTLFVNTTHLLAYPRSGYGFSLSVLVIYTVAYCGFIAMLAGWFVNPENTPNEHVSRKKAVVPARVVSFVLVVIGFFAIWLSVTGPRADYPACSYDSETGSPLSICIGDNDEPIPFDRQAYCDNFIGWLLNCSGF